MTTTSSRVLLITIILVTMTVAAVSLALAGWESAAIVGLLAAIVSLIGPLLTLVWKTEQVHEIVNSQRSADTAYRKQLADALRASGVAVPEDATGQHD